MCSQLQGEWYLQRVRPQPPFEASCERLSIESVSKFHVVVTYKKRLQVEACGEIKRSNPLETPEILVARVYATSVNMQVRNDHASNHV